MLLVVPVLRVLVPVLAWACNPISISFSNKIKIEAVDAQRGACGLFVCGQNKLE